MMNGYIPTPPVPIPPATDVVTKARPNLPGPPLVMLRWAVLTASGKNLRIYAPNRLMVARMLATVGEKLVYAMEAGYRHTYAGIVRPEWDDTQIDGWPGGKSGRPTTASIP